MLSKFFYRTFLEAFSLGAKIGAAFSPKTRQWVNGRANTLADWKKSLHQVEGFGNRPLLWLHTASLGEFEQAYPIAQALKMKYPEILVVASFFSPSGYEVISRKNMVDACGYLPFDNDGDLEAFIAHLNPNLVIWSKYDYWYNVLKIIQKRNIPNLLVSAIFREDQVFFKCYGKLYKAMLACFHHLFVQDDKSYKLLKTIGLDDNFISVSGDTRFDRVVEVAENWSPVPLVEKWLEGKTNIVVAGSTWKEDHDLLKSMMDKCPGVTIVLAPHQVEEKRISELHQMFPAAQRFSDLSEDKQVANQAGVLIIDNVGMLSRLYKYGDACYVGGGFSKTGVHNVLEPAVYGKPVIFGPNHAKYREVIMLINAGGGICVKHTEELNAWVRHVLQKDDTWKNSGTAAAKFIHDNSGATDIIVDYIQRNRLLIS